LLLKARPLFNADPHQLSLSSLIPCQRAKIKGLVVDIDDRFNEVFPAFDPFNKEFSPGSRIVDIFVNHFSFHSFKKSSNESFKACLLLLNNLTISSSLDSSIALVIMDTSIKNNISMFIAHIHIHNKDVIKIIHHAVNVILSETELFVIRYSINQATNVPGISKIVVITDLLHAA